MFPDDWMQRNDELVRTLKKVIGEEIKKHWLITNESLINDHHFIRKIVSKINDLQLKP